MSSNRALVERDDRRRLVERIAADARSGDDNRPPRSLPGPRRRGVGRDTGGREAALGHGGRGHTNMAPIETPARKKNRPFIMLFPC